MYRGLRKLGLDVDILPLDADFEGYKLILAPGVFHTSDNQITAVTGSGAHCLFGPRFNAKTADFSIPDGLPPSIPGLDLKVSYTETFRADMPRPVKGGGSVIHWLEAIEGGAETLVETATGAALLCGDGNTNYLAGWPDEAALALIVRQLCKTAGVETTDMPEGVRQRHSGGKRFVFNYASELRQFDGHDLPPAGVHWN